MKFAARHDSRTLKRHNAFTLIECLVYMAMLFLIIGMGFAAMYRSMNASAGLRHNADDISRTLKAGERWREDIRQAVRPITVEHAGDNTIFLHIPQAQSEVTYRFSTNTVSRRAGNQDWTPFLEAVRASDFIADQRTKVTAWRWEVELQLYRKRISSTRPLFTFISTPSGDLTK